MGTAQESKKCFECGFIFHDGLLCHTHGGNKDSLVIPEDAGLWIDLLQ